MSSLLYNPKNQWGKTLIPVGTPKSKTGTPDGEYIDISWIDTADSLDATDEKKIVSSEALKSIQEKFTETEEATNQKYEGLASQIGSITEQAEQAVQKATEAEQKTTDIENKLAQLEKGEITQQVLTVTITNGESQELDWKEGTALVSCIVDGNTFIPEISDIGGEKAKLIFFSPDQKPEGFQEPKSAKIVLIQPAV